MHTDPIADMLTRIRNARERASKVEIPASQLKMEIARILKEEGYIANFAWLRKMARRTIKVYLKYSAGPDARHQPHRAGVKAGPPRLYGVARRFPA